MNLVHLEMALGSKRCSTDHRKINGNSRVLVYLLIVGIVLNTHEVHSLKRLQLTASTACTLCRCQAGEYANDFVVCNGYAINEGLQDIEVISLPHYVNAIQLSNASKAAFNRGAIRIPDGKLFSISITNVKRTVMNDKSLTLEGPTSKLKMNVEVSENLHLKPRFISAKTGMFELSVNLIDTMSVEARAFDVLDTITVRNVGSMHLDQLSFKPNVPPLLQQPKFTAEFTTIRSIASLPPDSFPSAARITFTKCNISDLETNAFSGNQMINVTFNHTSIDRLHTHAFPEKSLIGNLQFFSCLFSFISQKALASAISLMEITHSQITSISQDAFHCPVAKVILYRNTFSTISNRTFLFESWSDLRIDMNQFKFVENGAFAEISASHPNVKFTFKGNHIHYANKNALGLQKLPVNIAADVRGNVFHKECDCEYQNWLDEVCGGESQENSRNLDFKSLIKNTSYCAVPDLASDCFDDNKYVSIAAYTKLSCTNDYNNDYDTACMRSASTAWNHFQEKIEVKTNKGILLILLLFVLASSLIVGILTLLRWIVYTFQMRGKYSSNDEEWNFTKVEELLIVHGSDDDANNSPSSFNGSLTQHYESLPLTTTEVLMESTPSSSPTKIKVETICREAKSNKSSLISPMHNKKLSKDDTKNEDNEVKVALLKEPSLSQDVANTGSSKSNITKSSTTTTSDIPNGDANLENNVSNMPKQSFYDEMINLLTEKLDDPENYGTVLDTKSKSSETTQQVLYQDPVTLQTET